MSSSTTELFIQLRKFCGTIELDARRLKQQLSDPHASAQQKLNTTQEQDTEFVNALIAEVDAFMERLSTMEDRVHPKDSQGRSTPSIGDILTRCQVLHSYNIKMMEMLAAQIVEHNNSKAKAAEQADVNDENCHNGGNNGSARKTRSSLGGSSSSSGGGRRSSRGKATPLQARAGDDEPERTEGGIYYPGCSLQSILTPIAASAQALETPPSAASDESGKTPVLPEWKLSEATRALVGVRGAITTPGPRPSLIPVAKSTERERARQEYAYNGPFSSTKVQQSQSLSLQGEGEAAPSAQCGASGISTLSLAGLKTPEQSHWGASSASPVSSVKTPETPQMGSPLKQTLLQSCATHTHTAEKPYSALSAIRASYAATAAKSATKTQLEGRLLAMGLGMQSPGQSPGSVHSRAPTSGASLSGYSLSMSGAGAGADCDSDASVDGDAAMESMGMSPPKLSKLLEPRALSVLSSLPEVTSHVDCAWVPPLSAADWESVPAFLKKPVTLADVNRALGCLNACIAEAQSGAGESLLSSFLPRERVTDLIGDSAKPIILLLCHMKRLDVAKEGGCAGFTFRRER